MARMKGWRRAAALLLAALLTTGTAFAQEGGRGAMEGGAQAFLEQADRELSASAGTEAQGLALVVFDQGGMLAARGYGHADLGGEQPVLPESTVFEYGSVTKLLVWLSAMQLHAAGQLDLSADIRGWLEPGEDRALGIEKPVTMLDLMNHRAGFEEYPLDMMLSEGAPQPALREALEGLAPVQRFQPGSVSAYSNYGCALAALVVERLSGLPFDEYAGQHLLRPLNMRSCAFFGTPTAQGTAQGEDGAFTAVAPSRVRLYPAGGLTGTAEDLARLGAALLGQDARLLPREAYAQMFSDSFSPAPGLDGMAHGWFTMHGSRGRGYQHAGNTNGFTAALVLAPERGLGFALLSNTAYTNMIAGRLSRLLLGEVAAPAALGGEAPPPRQGYFVSPRSAFRLPFYSLLSYVNAYHLSVSGEEAVMTSALLRIAGLLGADDMRLTARRRTGALYAVTNRPEMVETLYVTHSGGRISGVWSDGNYLIPLSDTPASSYAWALGSAIALLLLILYFFLSFLWRAARRLYRRLRGRERLPLIPFLLTALGMGIGLLCLLGLGTAAASESPMAAELNRFTLGIWALSVAAAGLVLYDGFMGRGSRPGGGKALTPAALPLAALMLLLFLWGQYRLI